MHISKTTKSVVDSCRFCWMCRHVCPVGNASGQERNTARARALACSLVIRDAATLEDVADNIYECTLCGACTNNCVTGWDPKIFVEEFKTQLAIQGKMPEYVSRLVDTYFKKGNIYGKDVSSLSEYLKRDSRSALVVGQDAMYRFPESVKNVVALLEKAKTEMYIDESTSDTGYTLYFLTGKTNETQEAMKKWADSIAKFDIVVFYDPCDMAFVAHQYKEWGISVKPALISFNNYLLQLIKQGKLILKTSGKEYSLQDHFAYSRDLEEESGRELIKAVGKNKEMFLIKKETNLAGHLIMNEWMPEIMKIMAHRRLVDAKNMSVTTLVTESPSEQTILKENTEVTGVRVISVEEMILENLEV